MSKNIDKKELLNPSAIWRSAPFWSWNDALNKDELTRQLDEMHDKGWGGGFMHTRVGLVTEYLSDKWMELTEDCAIAAGKKDMLVWLYDEDKWPSGYAGGDVPIQNKAFRNRALVCIKADQFDAETDTRLNSHIENGEEFLICERVARLDDDWFNGTCYIDLMNPDAVKAFLDSTHEKYKEKVGKYFGKEIPGIFTDEPCNLYRGTQFNAPYTQWSSHLPEFFKKLKGYDITENAAALFFKIGDYKKIRFDFYDATTRLFIESFSKQYYNWCQDNNLKLTGHYMAEDELLYQIDWSGSVMPHYEFMHWPGIDKLGRHVNQTATVKQLTSVADQLGKERAICEVFGCIGQQCAFRERKWIGDWQATLGINFVNPHLSLYSMRGERKRDYPCNIYYPQPWWEKEKHYADYTARLCYMLTRGERKVDILVINPIASVWANTDPNWSHKERDEYKAQYSAPYEELTNALIAQNLDFHFGDEIIMERHARVSGGKLIVGNSAYSTIVVPPSCTLSSSTLKLINEFAKTNKDNVIYIAEKPERENGVKKDLSLVGVFEKNVKDAVKLLDKMHSSRSKVLGSNGKVFIHERQTDDGKLLFAANTDSTNAYSIVIKVKSDSRPLVCDLYSGSFYTCPYKKSGEFIEIELTIDAMGSIMLLFNDDFAALEPKTAYFDSGFSFVADNKEPTTVETKFRALEMNSLVINRASLILGGKQIAKNELCISLAHDYFYKAAEGTDFIATYCFDSQIAFEGEAFAAIECAENLDKITLNGQEVFALKKKGEQLYMNDNTWMDASLTRVDISGKIAVGKNELVLYGKKSNNITRHGCHSKVKDFENHRPTEIENIYIVGDFGVLYKDCVFSIVKKADDISLYPTYSGKLEYTASNVEASEIIIEGEAACCELFVDGKSIGTKFLKPFRFEFEKPIKAKQVKAVLYTTLVNLTGPNWNKHLFDHEYISPWTFCDKKDFTNEHIMLEYGLKGMIAKK